MTENANPTIRLVASYQLMGDSHGQEFMDAVLGHAVEKGDIVAYNVTGVHVGDWGLQLVDFTVDVALDDTGIHEAGKEPRFHGGQSRPEVQEVGTSLLNEVVGDSDVEVRWVSVVKASVPTN